MLTGQPCFLNRYGMLASLSGILKEQIVPHLQPIISRMVECLQSEEGIKVTKNIQLSTIIIIIIIITIIIF